MLPSKLKRRLESTHLSVVSKSCGYFSRRLKGLNQQKGSFYKHVSIPSNALLASYKVAHRIAKCKKPPYIRRRTHSTGCCRYGEHMTGESARELLSKVPLSNSTVSRRIQHIVEDLSDQLIVKWGCLCPVWFHNLRKCAVINRPIHTTNYYI
jgi:hypothetical protein